MKTIATREELFAAAESADARSVAMLFAQHAPSGVSSLVGANAWRTDDWLPPLGSAELYMEPDAPLAVAIYSALIDVIVWIFSAEAIAVVGAEPLVEVIPIACQIALHGKSLYLIETMLASHVFAQLLSGEQQQRLLDQLLRDVSCFNTASVVDLLVAHGARVENQQGATNDSSVLKKTARRCTPAIVQAVVRNGALVAGASVFDDSITRAYKNVSPLLARGARPINAAMCLHRAILAGMAGAARLWLEHGFVDVDGRDTQGRTPLMRIHARHTRRPVEGGASLAKLLLEYGASVEAKDSNDKTPLRYALDSRYSEVVGLLLEHGADPNQPTGENHVVLDFLAFDRLDEPVVARKLEYMLQYGAKPFLPGANGLSAVDRLQQSEAGRAFIANHQQWFTQE